MAPLIDSIRVYFLAIKQFHLAVILLICSGVEDTLLTAENVSKYGIEIEGNPFLRTMISHFGLMPGLVGTKIVVLILIVYTAHMMNKTNYKIRGEYLLHGGSFCWLYGAASNLLIP